MTAAASSTPSPRPHRGPASRHIKQLHPEIKCKKPHFQHTLYQECGFLFLSLQCTPAICSVWNSHRVSCSARKGSEPLLKLLDDARSLSRGAAVGGAGGE
eukprot:2242310-Rhodomonas_salina.1